MVINHACKPVQVYCLYLCLQLCTKYYAASFCGIMYTHTNKRSLVHWSKISIFLLNSPRKFTPQFIELKPLMTISVKSERMIFHSFYFFKIKTKYYKYGLDYKQMHAHMYNQTTLCACYLLAIVCSWSLYKPANLGLLGFRQTLQKRGVTLHTIQHLLLYVLPQHCT